MHKGNRAQMSGSAESSLYLAWIENYTNNISGPGYNWIPYNSFDLELLRVSGTYPKFPLMHNVTQNTDFYRNEIIIPTHES